MNPFTNLIIFGLAALFFYVFQLPWVAIIIMGLRTAWWIFYEITMYREKKALESSLNHGQREPTTKQASFLNEHNRDLKNSDHVQEQSRELLFCTECGTAKSGFGNYCIECGTPFAQ